LPGFDVEVQGPERPSITVVLVQIADLDHVIVTRFPPSRAGRAGAITTKLAAANLTPQQLQLAIIPLGHHENTGNDMANLDFFTRGLH
jgi:hypothetical protein